MNRAYALLEIKSVDDEQRVIEGFASTPTLDQQGHSMDPAGAEFTLPIPFLAHHQQDKPAGEVFAATITPQGIPVKIRVAKDTGLEYVETTWKQIKSRLVRGLSIGWRPLEPPTPIKGGLRFTKWMIGEISAVTIPANTEASIFSIKSADQAASGRHSPGVTGSLPIVRAGKAARPMTIPEQITQFENTRAAKSARMTELMAKAAEDGVTLDDAQTEEYDTLAQEVKSVDAHLVRMRELEKTNLVKATPITNTTSSVTAADLRGGSLPVIQVKSLLPKGTAFTRFAMAMASGKGDSYATLERARSWPDTPEVELMVKAAVAAGTTTDATWAGPLVVAKPLVDEFLELLRPRTLLGRIPNLRQVPFNCSVPSQTAGGTYNWVGQGLAKPLTSAAFATVTLGFAKAAGIIVLTEELVRLSNPSAEALIREEMIAGIGQFLDTQFQDPAVAAVANVNPASITNGAATAAASGVTGAAARADLTAAVGVLTAAGIPLEGSVWLMSDSNAFGLGISINALGQPLFPGVSIAGGSIMGIPIVVSNSLSTRIVLMHAPSILYADDGGVRVDVSREASLQMDSAPANPSDASTVMVSLWQRNMVGLRAERFVSWTRARTAAVRVITGAAYNGT